MQWPEGRVVAVVPAYNEAGTIRDVLERTLHQLPEVIVVDDGSTDATVAEVAAAGEGVRLIRHLSNRGKAQSLRTGLAAAFEGGAAAVVTLDGDGQHAPEEIPRLLERARERPGCIVVGARRQGREHAPSARRRANEIADFWISWAAGRRITDSQSGFRLYPASAHSAVAAADGGGFVFESEVLIEAVRRGGCCSAVAVSSIYRPEGRPSHFRPVLDIARIVLMVAGKLLRWGMYPRGLWRVLRERNRDGSIDMP